ncbi:hypothetical protein C900_00944 [Fulvivirga imtechensis AK7]|uniref:Uncharacterized protein n=1 Tax=Fulvivirga imtechensis AK7 TaxID=1237149 RepID=L8JGW3_9BACT|nr:hypothetical protein [Fulvivirga imtechensis]ELR68106.1 hypothetical protein C900_00944 [Fulvivirga imtechensis AK7]
MTGVDPYASSYLDESPYSYAGANPIYYSDPSGGSYADLSRDDEFVNGGYNVFNSGGGSRSGLQWANQYRSVAMNAMLMSTSAFQNYYGINQMTGQQKAEFGRNYLASNPTAEERKTIGNFLGGELASDGTFYQTVSTALYGSDGTMLGAGYVIPQKINLNAPAFHSSSNSGWWGLMTDFAQGLWNSPFARYHVPDFPSLGVGFSGIAGFGGGTSFELKWVARGPDASFVPAVTVTQAVGAGYDVSAGVQIGGANYLGDVQDLNYEMLQTLFNAGDATYFGSAGLGPVSLTGTYTPTPTGYGILGFSGQFGPSLGKGAGGVMNTKFLYNPWKN